MTIGGVKRLLVPLLVLGLVLSLTGTGTFAWLNDVEDSTCNSITAGTWSGLTHILINEVMYDPEQEDPRNEWVELYNPTSSPIDVGNWTITDCTGPGTDYLVPDPVYGNGSTVIPPDGYAMITTTDKEVYQNYDIPNGTILLVAHDQPIGNGLSNNGDGLILRNLQETMVDAMEWIVDFEDVPGLPEPAVAEGNSVARYHLMDTDNSVSDFYEESIPSPGAQNDWRLSDQQRTTQP
jgi:predicted ribosomally synthesized peptide with SipW-like signal peptide